MIESLTEQHFIVYSAGYNCSKYIKKHMDSINNQTYKNYTVILVDDASTDNTYDEINKYKIDKYKIYRNKKNIKNAANIVQTLKPNTKVNDIVVILDLDDWFAHDGVLLRLNEIYTSENCWTTYGHYKHLRSQQEMIGYSIKVIQERSFRENKLLWHHLRTFKGFLLHNINNNDLKGPDGNFIPNTWDLAVGFPILEMTPPEKLRYIPEILMVYNALNPLRIKPKDRKNLRDYIRNKPKYKRLTNVK